MTLAIWEHWENNQKKNKNSYGLNLIQDKTIDPLFKVQFEGSATACSWPNSIASYERKNSLNITHCLPYFPMWKIGDMFTRY